MANLTILRVNGVDYDLGKPIDKTLSQKNFPADADKTGKITQGIIKNKYDPITEMTGDVIFPLEAGYIRVSGGTMTFEENDKTMRTPEGYPVKLNAGDVFSLNDSNYRYQFLYNNGGSTWGTSGWKTGDFTVSTNTDAYIILATADDSNISDLPSLLASVSITRAFTSAYKTKVFQMGTFRNIPIIDDAVQYTLECGYIKLESGETVFEESKVCLRTPESSPIILSPRDTVTVATGYRYQFVYLNDSGTAWTGTGWKTVAWQMPASLFRTGYIVVGKADGSAILNDTDIFSAVTITHTVHKAPFEYRDFYDSSHRGYIYIAPESTRASFTLAKKYGYNTVECDIRLTSDGKMVIHHNEGMPSNSSYKIAEHTLSELRENANMGTYAGVEQEILTIDDLLMLCKTLDLNLFVELKVTLTDSQKEELSQKIKDVGMSRKTFMICNVNDATYIYRANDEYIGLLLNYASLDNYITGLVNGKGKTAIYNQSANISDATVKACHDAGVLVLGWCVSFTAFNYTEETAREEILRAVHAGFDGMTIDQWTCANLISEETGYF